MRWIVPVRAEALGVPFCMGVAASLERPIRSCRSAKADAMMPGRQHLDAMRTTLTIDDGLMRQLRQKALDSGKPFKQVVDETLRAGLERLVPVERPRYVCPTFSMGEPRWPVNFDRALALAAELEDQEIFARLRQSR
jgi:hypothetical protein